MRWIISSVVTESGKPVLAVPPATKKLDVTGEALVAWNGSPPVAETLRAAVPLLSLAAGVKILQIGEAEGETAEEAAAYLSRHGIHARIERQDASVDGGSDGERLLAYCRSIEPAYRSEEHTSELQSLMRISYAVFCLKKKKRNTIKTASHTHKYHS